MKKIALLIDDGILNHHVGVRKYLFSLAKILASYVKIDFLKIDPNDKQLFDHCTRIVFEHEKGLDESESFENGFDIKCSSSFFNKFYNNRHNGLKYFSIFYGRKIAIDEYSQIIYGAPWLVKHKNAIYSEIVNCVFYDFNPSKYFLDSANGGYMFFANEHIEGVMSVLSYGNNILCISDYSKKQFFDYIDKAYENKVFSMPTYIPDGYEKEPRGINKIKGRVILVTPFDKRKGLHKIPSILNSLKNLQELVILGPIRCSYEDLKMFFDTITCKNITYYSNISTQQQVTLYASASLLLFPSLDEGLGLPVIEAQLSGCAVAISNIEPLVKNFVLGHILTEDLDNDAKILDELLQARYDVEMLVKHTRHLWCQDHVVTALKAAIAGLF